MTRPSWGFNPRPKLKLAWGLSLSRHTQSRMLKCSSPKSDPKCLELAKNTKPQITFIWACPFWATLFKMDSPLAFPTKNTGGHYRLSKTIRVRGSAHSRPQARLRKSEAPRAPPPSLATTMIQLSPGKAPDARSRCHESNRAIG